MINAKQWAGAVWSKLTDMPMERKLLAVFLVVICLPLAFIGYISYSNYSGSIEKTTLSYSNNLMIAMMERMDDYAEDMMRVSSIPAYQAEIKQNLIRSNTYYERLGKNGDGKSGANDINQLLQIQRGIQSSVKFINNIKRGANVVYIFDAYGNGYYSTETGSVRSNLEESYRRWKSVSDQSSGEALLLGTETYVSTLNSKKNALTVVRKILDDISLKPIGLIAVDTDFRVIEDQIVEMNKLTHGSALIMDDRGSLIYDSDNHRSARDIAGKAAALSEKNGHFYADIDGQRQLVIYTTSADTHWKWFVLIPEKEMNKDSIRTRNTTWAAAFAIIGIALLISILLSIALTKPLRKMMRLMRKVQEGDLSVQFPIRHRDEIGQLGLQFNRMIVRIDHLIKDIYDIEAKKNEAEIHALQNQINPHFMYNTLETIRMFAELNDDEAVADMLTEFGQLLRYSIGDVRERTTVRAELDHVKHYVEMLNYRYPNRFRLHLHLEENQPFFEIPTLRLLLQPIVENAIQHGYDDSKPVMNIEILITQPDDRSMLMRIADDGVGIAPETRERLNQAFHHLQPVRTAGRGGIGLRNVNERIKLHCGASYGIQVLEGRQGGTEVVLKLPVYGYEDKGLTDYSDGGRP